VYPLFPTLSSFYNDYEMPLQRCLFNIEQRGLLVDELRLNLLHKHIVNQKERIKHEIKKLTGIKVITSEQERAVKKGTNKTQEINIGASGQLILWLKAMGFKVPISRNTGNETANQAAIEEMFAKTGNALLRHILTVRELNKIDSTNVQCGLRHSVLYCSYLATGTKGGRRSSRASFLGIGTNHQNLPKHSELGQQYRKCIISRQGKIFLSADLSGAEDWVVHGIIADLGGPSNSLEELRKGINRHKKLASILFGLSEPTIKKDGLEYYLAKRSRHGFNYGMHGPRQARILAGEGIGLTGINIIMPNGRTTQLPKEYIIHHAAVRAAGPTSRQKDLPKLEEFCEWINNKIHITEPQVRDVYQGYIRKELQTKRRLTTPIGRVRDFLDLRPRSDNEAVYRDGYSYIPQSTVGDITGLAILGVEAVCPIIVSDGHDAIITEVNDSLCSVELAVNLVQKSYSRVVRFENGTEITIPLEFEIGYNLGEMVPWDVNLGRTGLVNTLATLNKVVKHQRSTTGGQQPVSLELV
jgi:hypothetical protein